MKNKIKDNNKKPGKKIKILVNILLILMFITALFIIYNLINITAVETKLRYIGMAILFLFNLILIIILKGMLNKKTKTRYIVFFIVVVVLIIAQAGVGYYLFRAYTAIDNFNKKDITYEVGIITLKDSKLAKVTDLKDKKIGIVKDTKSIDYMIGLELITDNKLKTNNLILEFESPIDLVKELYEEKIDAMIITTNYPTMFTSIDEYNKITDETKSITTKAKTLTKEQIADYTGEELADINQGDSITEPFTILIMGVDATGVVVNKNSTGNGDALMLVTFNPKTLNSTILSIPRDTYTYITCMGKENKITHAAWGGESCMIKTIERMTDMKINYYFKINFYGVVRMVNALGGIELTIPDKMDGVCEQNSRRQWGNNQICFKKGTHIAMGEEALAYARHRKTLVTGDFERAQHQQEVVQGILNKLRVLKNANMALELLELVGQSMDTNFTTKQLLSFYDIAKTIMVTSSNSDSLITMQRTYLTGSGQTIYDERAQMPLYNFIYNKSSLSQIVKSLKANLTKTPANSVKTMNFDIKEEFELSIIGTNPTSGTTVYTLLPNFVGQSKSYTTTWLSTHGISYTIVEKEQTTGTDGQVLAQSLPYRKRIDLISGSITITVAKVVVTPVEPPVEENPNQQGGNQQGNDPEDPGNAIQG